MVAEINPVPDLDSESASDAKSGDSLSMHANVPVWCDCCTCEAEPYWVEAFNGTDAEVDTVDDCADHNPR